MKRTVTVAALAISMFAGSVALADPWHGPTGSHHSSSDRDQGGRRDRHYDSRRDGHYGPRHDERRPDRRRDWRYGYRHDYRPPYPYRPSYPYRMNEYRRPWGYSERSWYRGDRLPVAYYAPYRIYDYRRCGLRSPPRGYYWVRVNHDAVLAAVATGIVLDVLYDFF